MYVSATQRHSEKTTGFRKALPWIENIAFGLVIIWITHTVNLTIDLKLIYIMIMGLIYGQAHSLLAAAFSIASSFPESFVLNQLDNATIVSVVEKAVSYGLLAFVSSYSKSESLHEIEISRDSHGRIDQLYQTACTDLVQVREAAAVLAESLKTCDQSYGRLYRAIKKLECVGALRVLQEALQAVYDLTGFDRSALYVTQNGKKFDLFGCFSESMHQDPTIILDDEILFELKSNQIFLNTNMRWGVPDAAIPIYNHEKDIICGVILLGDLPFNKMSSYTKQMLVFSGNLLSDYFTKAMTSDFSFEFTDEKGIAL